MLQVKYLYYPSSLKYYILRKIVESSSLSIFLVDKLLYILHKMFLSLSQSPDYYSTNGVTIHSPTLKHIIAEPNYKPLIDALIDWKLLIKYSDSYHKGDHSKCYKLHEDIEKLPINRNAHVINKTNRWMSKLIRKCRKQKDPTNMQEYQLQCLNELTVSPALNNYIISRYPECKFEERTKRISLNTPKQLIGLFTILDRDYYSDRKPTANSRLYTNITSLKKEFRQFLLLEGKQLIQLDVKNAQVFLGYFVVHEHLQKLFKKEIPDNELPKDMLLFKTLSVEGRFYEYLAEKIGVTIEDKEERGKFKKMFFKYIWFSETVNYCKLHPLNRAFHEHFPTVATIIEEIKQPKHNEFPIRLQNLEAEIMLDIVGKKLMQLNIPFLTIHDALLLNSNEHKELAMLAINDAFLAKFGIVPTVDVEDYSQVTSGEMFNNFR